MHRRMPNVHFGGGLKFPTGGGGGGGGGGGRNEKNGPGSFVKPSAIDKQLETRKRNMIKITSLNSTLIRDSPEKGTVPG